MNFVDPGETVTVSYGPRDTAVALEVGQPCEPAQSGHWACTCGEGIANNMGLSNHDGAGHRIFWICHEHGPESVPADERG
jgi:hypothetical protein